MDPTIASLQQILQSGEYEAIENVPIFDENTFEYVDAETKEKRSFHFDRSYLEEVVANCNKRAKTTGDLIPIGPGHTSKDLTQPETSQPPIWAYAAQLHLGPFGLARKLAILATFFVKKIYKDQVAQFPRRSVELWTGQKFIDWIALCKRTPQRDLGLLTFQNDLKLRYEMGFDMEEKDKYDPTKPPDKNEPAMPHESEVPEAPHEDEPAPGVPPEHHEHFMKSIKHHFPKLHEMHAHYMKSCGGKEHFGAGPGMPGAGNTFIPGDSEHPKKLNEVERMQKESENIRFTKLEAGMKQLAERNKALEIENADTKLRFEKAECERLVQALEYEGFQLDRAEEVKGLVPLSAEARGKRLDYIRKHYKQDPTGKLEIPGLGPVNLINNDLIQFQRNGPDTSKTSREQHEQAIKLATVSKGKMDYNEALAQVKGATNHAV